MTKRAPKLCTPLKWLWPAAALSLLGCPDEELAPIAPCTVSGVFDEITQNSADEVDVLFMVDDSKSMEQEQQNLAENLPELVEILASGEIKNAAGTVIRKFPAVKSLHLGVVTSNMGINGAPASEANLLQACAGLGDDGVLINVPTPEVMADPNCMTTFPLYLTFPDGNVSPTELGTRFGCISRTGSQGCGFEQQLEAVWKALAPKTEKSFYMGTAGHGNDTDFLRPDSVIAVILVSDEEDSSAPGKELFFLQQDGKNNVRQYGDYAAKHLHKIERYVDGLRSLRPENPDLMIFAGIVGVPKGVESMTVGDTQDFDAILGSGTMQYKEKPGSEPGELAEQTYATRVCANENYNPISVAYPAPRFVQVAKAFGKNGVIRSICDDDFSSALNAIIVKIADQLQGACLERTLLADPKTNLVPCGLVEYLPSRIKDAGACKKEQGRAFLETRKDEADGLPRVVCTINQLAVDKKRNGCDANSPGGESQPLECLSPNPGTDPKNPRVTTELVGWYYDDFSKALRESDQCNQQRIAFTKEAEQGSGSVIRFECLQPVFSVFEKPKGIDAVNKPCKAPEDLAYCPVCQGGGACQSMASSAEFALACDPARDTCQIRCARDSNCPDGWVCENEGNKGGFCLNPTCPAQ